MIESIWPVVQQANMQCPAHARVSRSMILLADPAMPFLRAPKGTIQRQATLNMYEKTIDDLYLGTQSETMESQVLDLKIADTSSVTEVVRGLVKRVTEWNHFEDTADFFALGMDSLQILHLRRGLISAIGLPSITTGFIYAHPSVDLLTHALMQTGSQEETPAIDSEKARIALIGETLRKYEEKIDDIATSRTSSAPTANTTIPGLEVVLLTGSTGALGSFLLDTLLQDKKVSLVYCLNRAEDSKSVQMARNKERGLLTEFPSSRVIFRTADLTKPSFGLDDKTFNEMKDATTRIIHNAWPVDFNKTLRSFQPPLDGVLGLVSFAATSTISPSLFFISSISSVGNYQNTQSALPLIPETVLSDLASSAPMGYGESKYIAERMLDYAARKLHLTTAAARVGQIAGTAENPRGWNRQEWFPSLVLSSRYLGAVPETLGLGGDEDEGIDWVPIDQLVGVLSELALGLDRENGEEGARICHPIHPHPISWKSLLPTVQENLTTKDGSQVKIVSYQEWVKLLKESSVLEIEGEEAKDTEEMLHQNPGVKLLDFYESLLAADGLGKTLRMETKQTLASSELLRNLEPIQNSWLEGWIKGWTQS